MNRDLYDACDRGALQKLGRLMERTGGLSKLLEASDPSLEPFPASHLRDLSQMHREFMRWKEAAREMRRVLAKSGLTLPDGILQEIITPHELGALERTARMCPRSTHPDHGSWFSAVKAHVELWDACVEIGLSVGTAAITVIDSSHPDAREYASIAISKVNLNELRSYQWLGARRGERAGVIGIDLDLPREAIKQQGEARLSLLGLSSQKRGVDSVLQELVWNNLEPVLVALLDRKARVEALGTAASAYTGLLALSPLVAKVLIAAHVNTKTAPIGIAVLSGDGALIAQEEIPAGTDVTARVFSILKEYSPDAAVLPVTAGDSERLRLLESTLEPLLKARILPAALTKAREGLDYPKMVAGAIVIGRRALNPAVEYGAVNPASLGLGEYTSDMDDAMLAEVLIEARLLNQWGRKRRRGTRSKDGPSGPGSLGKGKTIRQLNPLVKTIRDLKPGMAVDGIVTNLTRFGAFVNIGLTTEAMIHVSQLSTEFVDEPSQVVRIGQNVSARVLEVVPEKSRIALSLKPETGPMDRQAPRRDSQREKPNGMFGPQIEKVGDSTQRPKRSGSSDKPSRSAAMADLDALFKKR